MKRFFLIFCLYIFVDLTNAQITIMDNSVQERVVSKPQPFDSLSNIVAEKDPIQYKKYIGYKLYCIPLSKKFECKYSDCSFYLRDFKYKSSENVIIPHKPYSQTDVAMMFGDIKKLKGSALAQYKAREEEYEKLFKVKTDIYNATYNEKVPDRNKFYTPYESIENTYFTILNIEIGDKLEKDEYFSLDKWKNPYKQIPGDWRLRFTLKNETSGEEIYWILYYASYLSNTYMFLVPYFEKMQKVYKGKQVVATTEIPNLVDVERGEAISIKAGEEWKCYDVTFVNLETDKFVEPYFFLEREGAKVMIKFSDFSKECNGIFTKEDRIYRPTFILAEDFNEIVAKKQRAVEEKQQIEEEQKRQEELARQERTKQIMQKYGNKYGKLICEGKVCLQMTKEMCIESWGEPLEINTTIVQGLVHEQWVYGWQTYLYFDNNILTAIQN